MASYGNHNGSGYYEPRRRGYQGAGHNQSSQHKRGGNNNRRGNDKAYNGVGPDSSSYNQGRGYAGSHARGNPYKANGSSSPSQEQTSTPFTEAPAQQKGSSTQQGQDVQKHRSRGQSHQQQSSPVLAGQPLPTNPAPLLTLGGGSPAPVASRPAKKIWNEEEYTGINKPLGGCGGAEIAAPAAEKKLKQHVVSSIHHGECHQRNQAEQVTDTAASSIQVEDEQVSLGKRSQSEVGEMKLVGTKAHLCDFLDSLLDLEQCLSSINVNVLQHSKIISEKQSDLTTEETNQHQIHEVKVQLTERPTKQDYSNFAL